MSPPKKTNCLVTGANGFIGRNLVTALQRVPDINIVTQVSSDSPEALEAKLQQASVVFHLAGANRPTDDSDFARINTGLTESIAKTLLDKPEPTTVVFSSSIQVDRDNPYGQSKRGGEQALQSMAEQSDHSVVIYRLPNVFGKWSKPNYNTVVATFCHNIARDLPITVSNPDHELHLVYIDEVVRCFLRHLESDDFETFTDVDETHRITLGELATTLRGFRESRQTSITPAVGDALTKYLYSTYLSFLPKDGFSYPVELKQDERGWLFELVKSPDFGQIFVSTTKPGITRGNHYHDTKVEKFCLIRGEGIIRFRQIDSEEILEYPVDGKAIQIVDIPPGLTHSIENTGSDEMIVLFWANEIFNPDQPDTYWVPVREKQAETRN